MSERWYGSPRGWQGRDRWGGQRGSMGTRATGPALEERARGPVSLEPTTQGTLWKLGSSKVTLRLTPLTNSALNLQSGNGANYKAT